MKRTWATWIFLSLIFSFVLVSCGNSKTVESDFSDSAEQTTESVAIDGGDPVLLSYRVDAENNCATILGRGEWLGKDLVIPSEIGGVPVTAIAEQAFRCGGLRSVVVPESVTVIGESAFAECHKLEAIILPSAHIAGDGETEKPFGSIFGVDEVWGTGWPINLTSITITGGTDIPAKAFYNNRRVETIRLGDSITVIGDYAFYECRSLKKFNLPEHLTKIGDCAFVSCVALEKIEIPEQVTEIGGSAFSACMKLTDIVIPDSVQTIGPGAFYRCEELKSITIGNGATVIEPHTFERCKKLSQVTLGNRVRELGEYAFEDCKSLLVLILPDSVDVIRSRAFFDSNLRSLSVGNNLTRIEASAFERLRGVPHADLEEILYRGTETEWNEVEKCAGWDYEAGSFTVRFEKSE